MKNIGPMLYLLSVLVVAPLCTAAADKAPLKPEPYFSAIAQRAAAIFPKEHLLRAPVDESLSRKTWTNFISSFDYDRLYFLASDIQSFRADETTLGERMRAGDVMFAYRVFDVLRDRVSNRVEFVNSVLAKGFDLDTKETYRWKRKDAPWAKDTAELDEIWRKKIKNEYLQIVLSKEMAESAATNKTETAATNKEENVEILKKMTPEETIRQRYKQFLTTITDSDAEMVFSRFMLAFTQAYDPHSSYMSPASSEDFDIEMKLSLEGIGALLSSEDGAAKVVRVIPGGPADMDKSEKRLRAGDKIIAVGQGDAAPEDILHLPLQKIVQKIRGKKGTKVVLTVIPASDPAGTTTKKVELIRDEVKLEEQAATSKIQTAVGSDGKTNRIGVITLPAFYANMKVSSEHASGYRSCAHDVQIILDQFRTNNINGILIDLRNNGGGSLLEAIKLTSLFINNGYVVQVKERQSIKPIQDSDTDQEYTGPLMVLVNRLSASASEIMAGALQDYGRAIIVGDSKTHGKGTVQTILPLGRDQRYGSIKITTASYYRISGDSTQLKGVASDIVVPSGLDFMELGEDHLPNALRLSPDQPASYRKSPELAQLIPLLREKSVKRRADDARFKAYGKLLQRIDAMTKAEELPLNLAERRELAKTEKDLLEMENEINPESSTASDDPKKNGKPDLILIEGLRIMADQIAATPAQPVAQEKKTEKGVVDSVIDWLKDIL